MTDGDLDLKFKQSDEELSFAEFPKTAETHPKYPGIRQSIMDTIEELWYLMQLQSMDLL